MRLDFLGALACLGFMLGAASGAWAQGVVPEISPLRLEQHADGVTLSTTVQFELPAVVEDALHKGIAMFFVAEVELYRDRWYWTDRKVATTTRHMRLAYQPLTRRWRLTVAPGPIGNSSLGVLLSQQYDSLSEALASVQRFTGWKIAEATDIEPDARYNVEFRFKLDMTQLPRPFQIGAVGQGDWVIVASRNQRLNPEPHR
ncbi:MAG: DUF4390 domain-containing protein [Burkholderiaceae bacterium]|nr:DUF4390 domain-containing protein [Burkholderiaceae bacterium]MDZ4146372.1 DUF4390 domain-containing protein [Burkholderiales bacterium]